MVLQVIAVTMIILSNVFSWLKPFSIGALWLVVIFALASAIGYFRKFWKTVDVRGKASQRRKLVILKKSQPDVPTQ